jgi:hypothetical protein
MINSKIQLLDERNRRFSEFFDEFLFSRSTNQGRQKMTKVVIDALEFAKRVAVSAKANATNEKLLKWLDFK